MRVVVTGGSGKAGRAVVRDLVAEGHRVLNVDLVADPDPVCEFRLADLTEPGQAFEVLRRQDAVVHLAAIPRPYLATDEVTFRTNVGSTYGVFAAAVQLELQRVVWASSETTLGLPFDSTVAYFPIDEEPPPVPKSTYALSKVVARGDGPLLLGQIRHPVRSGCASRTSSSRPTTPGSTPSRATPASCSWNAWGWVDRSDVAQACRLALTADVVGADVFIIAAADTVMVRRSRELLTEVFPDVPVRGELDGRQTLLSIDKARRVLGYRPEHSLDARFDPNGERS